MGINYLAKHMQNFGGILFLHVFRQNLAYYQVLWFKKHTWTCKAFQLWVEFCYFFFHFTSLGTQLKRCWTRSLFTSKRNEALLLLLLILLFHFPDQRWPIQTFTMSALLYQTGKPLLTHQGELEALAASPLVGKAWGLQSTAAQRRWQEMKLLPGQEVWGHDHHLPQAHLPCPDAGRSELARVDTNHHCHIYNKNQINLVYIETHLYWTAEGVEGIQDYWFSCKPCTQCES